MTPNPAPPEMPAYAWCCHKCKVWFPKRTKSTPGCLRCLQGMTAATEEDVSNYELSNDSEKLMAKREADLDKVAEALEQAVFYAEISQPPTRFERTILMTHAQEALTIINGMRGVK